MPKRAVVAIVTTVLGLILLFSFKTPADEASALGAPGLVSLAPETTSGPLAGTSPAPGITPAPANPTSEPAANGSGKGSGKSSGKGSGTFTGAAVENPFGEVQVQITLAGGKITAVTALQLPTHGRSGFISQSVAPILQGEALTAQSAQIDTVSGATYTSDAYAQSLQSAIDQSNG